MVQPKPTETPAGEDIIAKSLAKDIEVLVEPPEEEVAKGKRKPPARGGKKERVVRNRKTKKPAAKPHGNPSLIYAVKVLKQTGKDPYNRPVYAIYLYVAGFDKDPMLIFENLQSGAADVDVISLKNWGSAEFILEVIFSAKTPSPPPPAPQIAPVKTYLLFKGKKLVRRIPIKAGETFAFHGNGYFMKAKAMKFASEIAEERKGDALTGSSASVDEWLLYQQHIEFRNIDGEVRVSPLEFFYSKKDKSSHSVNEVTMDGFSSRSTSGSISSDIYTNARFQEYVTRGEHEEFTFFVRHVASSLYKSSLTHSSWPIIPNVVSGQLMSTSASTKTDSYLYERLSGFVTADASDPRRGENELFPRSMFNTTTLATIRTDRKIVVSPTNTDSIYLLSAPNERVKDLIHVSSESRSEYYTSKTQFSPAQGANAPPRTKTLGEDRLIRYWRHRLAYRTGSHVSHLDVRYMTPGLPETKRADGTFDDRVIEKNDKAAYFMTTYRQDLATGTPPEYIGDKLQGLFNHVVALDVFGDAKVFRIMASSVKKTVPSKGWWDDGEYKDQLFEHKGKTYTRLKLVDRVETETKPFKVTVEVYGRKGDRINAPSLEFAGLTKIVVHPFKPKEKVVEKAPETVLPTQDGYVEWRVSHYSFCQSPVRYKIKKNPKDKAGTI